MLSQKTSVLGCFEFSSKFWNENGKAAMDLRKSLSTTHSFYKEEKFAPEQSALTELELKLKISYSPSRLFRTAVPHWICLISLFSTTNSSPSIFNPHHTPFSSFAPCSFLFFPLASPSTGFFTIQSALVFLLPEAFIFLSLLSVREENQNAHLSLCLLH